MSLRLKLLALGLATLVLPWAGCRYAREMEAALREVREETGLRASAITKLADIKYVYVRSWGDGERLAVLLGGDRRRHESTNCGRAPG